jgi:dTDP-4-amino-4,6-dideoxygalactose transaminase
MIQCANPAAQYRTSKAAIRQAMSRVLESGSYVLGAEVLGFERNFARVIGCEHAIGVGSGTDALILALRAFAVGSGDEVITVSHTALATVAAVIATGATPILVDIDSVYATINPDSIVRAITKRTKAIVVVHLYGQAADLDAITAIATKHKLMLIEDCAQAAGGLYKGRRLGSIGDVGTFSFYPTKNLGAIGDGGAVVTNDARVAERVERLRQYGWDHRRDTRYPGVNSRLDPIQAAILNAKLPRLDTDNSRRIQLAARYAKGLAGLPVTVPPSRPDSQHVFHLYVISCRNRDALIKHLERDGIAAGIHYPKPAHRHRGYDAIVRLPSGGLPETDRLVRSILSLPLYPELKPVEVDRVIASVRGFYAAQTKRASPKK